MKTKIITVLAVLFTITFQAQAAYVLTFDDIGTTESYENIPNGYGGFNWGGLYNGGVFSYLNAPVFYPDSGFTNGLVSGDYVASCTSYGTPGDGKITGELFTFNGAYLTAGWNDGLNIQVDGYLNDSLVYTTTVTVDTTGPIWFNFNYIDVDELRFSASGGTVHEGYPDYGTYFVMDNFTYIPEPATLLLFTIGGLLLRNGENLCGILTVKMV